MKVEIGKFCVYIHVVDGEIVYVGKGRSYRPFETSRRNAKWCKFMESIGSFEVEILGWYDEDGDARIEESKLIRKFNPKLNQHQTSGYTNSKVQREASSVANKGKILSEKNKVKNIKLYEG